MKRMFGTGNNWLLLVAGALLAAGTVMASGGGSAGGGGAAGGGGGTGGGGTTAACAPIQSLKVVPGYYKVWGAIWTSFSLKACNGTFYAFEITATNLDTGLVSYVNRSYTMSGVIDYDFAPLSTNFRFDIAVVDPYTGAVVDTRSVITATPGPKPPGTI